MTAIKRIFIANRGEIAVRIIRTCRALGIETVLGVSEARPGVTGREACHPHGLPGPFASRRKLLEGPTIVHAAVGFGCDAVHPGYGFLSENRALAEACVENGLIFIGPDPENLEAVGDKLTARGHAEAAGVPLVPGASGATVADSDELAARSAFRCSSRRLQAAAEGA